MRGVDQAMCWLRLVCIVVLGVHAALVSANPSSAAAQPACVVRGTGVPLPHVRVPVANEAPIELAIPHARFVEASLPATRATRGVTRIEVMDSLRFLGEIAPGAAALRTTRPQRIEGVVTAPAGWSVLNASGDGQNVVATLEGGGIRLQHARLDCDAIGLGSSPGSSASHVDTGPFERGGEPWRPKSHALFLQSVLDPARHVRVEVAHPSVFTLEILAVRGREALVRRLLSHDGGWLIGWVSRATIQPARRVGSTYGWGSGAFGGRRASAPSVGYVGPALGMLDAAVQTRPSGPVWAHVATDASFVVHLHDGEENAQVLEASGVAFTGSGASAQRAWIAASDLQLGRYRTPEGGLTLAAGKTEPAAPIIVAVDRGSVFADLGLQAGDVVVRVTDSHAWQWHEEMPRLALLAVELDALRNILGLGQVHVRLLRRGRELDVLIPPPQRCAALREARRAWASEVTRGHCGPR